MTRKLETKIKTCTYFAAGPALFRLHSQKGLTICIFQTYQAFKTREGIVFWKNLTKCLKILVFWIKKNKLQTISLIGVQGHVNIFLLLLVVSYFMVWEYVFIHLVMVFYTLLVIYYTI